MADANRDPISSSTNMSTQQLKPAAEREKYIHGRTDGWVSGWTNGPESKLCMERSAVFRTYGTKGLRNWSCSGPLECDEI